MDKRIGGLLGLVKPDRKLPAGAPVYQQHVLAGLQRPGRHVYAGTVPGPVVARRRARNRVARASRRRNRVGR